MAVVGQIGYGEEGGGGGIEGNEAGCGGMRAAGLRLFVLRDFEMNGGAFEAHEPHLAPLG